MDSSNRVAEVNRQAAEAEKLMQAEARLKKKRAEIANQWYDDGCVIVVALKDPGKLTSLTVGLPVIDRTRGTPLSAGTIVCDADGNAARLIKSDKGKPVVGETYFTGDRKRIGKAVKRSNARYALPNQ